MAQRLALFLLTIGSATALACLLFNHPSSTVLFTLIALGFAPALIALGAARRGSIGRLAFPLLGLTLWLEGCGVVMLLLPGRAAGSPVWLGFPAATVVLLLGLGLVPLVLVSLLYAWDFRRFGVTEDDLKRLREAVRRRAVRPEEE